MQKKRYVQMIAFTVVRREPENKEERPARIQERRRAWEEQKRPSQEINDFMAMTAL